MKNAFQAGAAKKDITPHPDHMKKLFCVMPMTKFEHIDSPLYVRVIALKNGEDIALIVQYELDQAPFPTRCIAEISRKHGIAEENIFMLGNHSHEVPVTGIRLAEPEHNAKRESAEYLAPTSEYEAQVTAAMFAAVDEALGNLRPARIGWGEGESLINEHREMKYSPVLPADHTLFVLKIEALDASPIAFLLNYSSHNSCVKLDWALSADMEGCIAGLMEEEFPGAVSMWTLSAHGDLMPRKDYWNIPIPNKTYPPFADPNDTDNIYFRRKRILSLRQFEDALNILEKIQCAMPEDSSISGAVRFAEVPVCPVTENPDGSVTHMGGLASISAQVRAELPKRAAKSFERALSVNKQTQHRLRLHTVKLGNLVLIGNGGKLYNSFKMQIRSMFPPDYTTVVFSQDCCETSTLTYVRDDRALFEEAAENHPVDICPGETTKAIDRTMRQMTNDLGIDVVGKTINI